jgi:hypothetical protein
MAKLVLVPVGTVDNVGDLASILGCGTSSLPLKYLSLPLVACFKAKSIWDCIVEKIRRRLVSWKMMYLSKGGRVTLIIIIKLIGNINIYKGATHVHRKYTIEPTYTNAFKLKMEHISLRIPQALKLAMNATLVFIITVFGTPFSTTL